jgi:hypothetical protein
MSEQEMKSKLSNLERTILELGTELFSLKSSLAKNKESQETLIGVFNGIKQLLNEKGLITLEDFEAAVELGEALESVEIFRDNQIVGELEKLKKTSH